MNLLSMAGVFETLKELASSGGADFSIKYLTDFTLFGQKLSITTTHISLFIVTLVLVIFAICANKCIANAKEIPGYFQNFVELIVEMLDNMVDGVMGKNAKRFVNYISAVFIFILVCNISGLFGLRAPTADYAFKRCDM